MWRNYWTVAVRALAKSRTYSIINIAGLAIGMAACIMILLYIRYEQSYDKWLPGVENTYQFQAWYPHPTDGAAGLSADVRLRHQGRDQEGFSAGREAASTCSGQRACLPQGRAGLVDQELACSRTTIS